MLTTELQIRGGSCAVLFSLLLVACGGVSTAGRTSIVRTDSGVVLPPWAKGAPGLVLPLPDGYRIKQRKGPDFDVFELEWRGAGDKAGGVVFVGLNPELFHERTRDVSDIQKGVETIRDSSVTVYTFRVRDENLCKEAVLPRVYGVNLPSKSRILVHIAAFGTDPDAVEDLWEVLGQVRPNEAVRTR